MKAKKYVVVQNPRTNYIKQPTKSESLMGYFFVMLTGVVFLLVMLSLFFR